MSTNSLITKKTIYGFDLLKFILAILIIAGHTSLFEEFTTLGKIRENLSSIAVPTFMAISAYLFFKKIYSTPSSEDTKYILIKTIKRLSILFLCWYALMLPMTYITFFSVATLKETFFAIFLSSTFRGYWFIKALIINTCIFYYCRKNKAFYICIFIVWIIYLFFSYNYICHFIDFPYRPYYSFYYHLAYYSVGVLLAKYENYLLLRNYKTIMLIFLWLILFALGFINYYNPLYRFLSIPLIFILFYKLKLVAHPCYKTIRNMSIILYMVHFLFIWLYNNVCDFWLQKEPLSNSIFLYSIIKFIIVTALSIFIAWLILKCEKKPKLRFLHYLH